MIAIIDYGMGNLRSVHKSMLRLGRHVHICNSPEKVQKAEKIILPGVGHFARGMQHLRDSGMFDVLKAKVFHDRVPILGICLGMQLLTESSQEGNAAGLGWIAARTKRFDLKENTARLKVPHMGWNSVNLCRNGGLFKGVDADAVFYFVHTFYVECRFEQDIVATTTYGCTFVSAFERDNIFGTQFHPEKSHDDGMRILKNFVEL